MVFTANELKVDDLETRIQSIKDSETLPDPPSQPIMPDLRYSMTSIQKLNIIQKFIESFEYNYSGTPFVNLKRSRGMTHISSAAKQIIRTALPIQCVEATFLGCLLTAEMKEIDRVPLSFKSKFEGKTFRHIVLAIRVDGKWGALGISRRNSLMNKPFKFSSLGDLVLEYKKSYRECCHKLVCVYPGLPFVHAGESTNYGDAQVKWRAIKVRMKSNEDALQALNLYAKQMGGKLEYYLREGKMPPKIN